MSQGCQEPSPQASSGHAQGGSPHCLFPGHLAALTRHAPGHTANDSNSPSPVTERGWRRGRGTPGSEAWRSEVGAGRFAPCPRGSGPHFPGLSLPRRPLIPGRFDSTRRGRGAAVSSPPRWRQRPGGPGCWPEGSARPPHLWLGERSGRVRRFRRGRNTSAPAGSRPGDRRGPARRGRGPGGVGAGPRLVGDRRSEPSRLRPSRPAEQRRPGCGSWPVQERSGRGDSVTVPRAPY